MWDLFLIIAALFAVLTLVYTYLYKYLIPSSNILCTDADGRPVLKYPKAYFHFYIFGSLFCAGVGWFAAYTAKGNPIVIVLIFAVMAVLALYCAISGVVSHFTIHTEFLVHKTAFSGNRKTKWSEISKVSYSKDFGYFKLQTNSGLTIRISTILTSLSEFAGRLLQEKGNFEISPDDLTVLEETERGNLPSAMRSSGNNDEDDVGGDVD